ncbi:MAG: peptide chain release factor N(5)-glutamine methyltransferase [Desulfococcaceae bacterium]
MSTPTPPRPPWTIRKVLGWTVEHFRRRDIESPRPSAEILLAHALGLRRIDLYVRHDQPLDQDELDRFRPLIRRRAAGEPAAYIVGEREFWSLPMGVNPGVLIPRPETECLVEAALAELPPPAEGVRRVLELGTGSGAPILAVASERPGHRFFASDRSPAALRTARANAARNGLADRIRFFLGDWLDPIRSDSPAFDLLIANPPYIVSEDIPGLQVEVARYEPREALDGGADGLSAIRRLIRDAPARLRAGGVLLLEIGADQRDAVVRLAEESGGWGEVRFRRDFAGHDRIVRLAAASSAAKRA